MKKSFFAAFMMAAVVSFASCDRNDNTVVISDFEISVAQDGNTVRVTVDPSDEGVSYSTGIIMEDDYATIGEDGLASYVTELLSSGAAIEQGVSNELYQDLLWQTTYYVYVAQVDNGTVVGTPVIESVRTYRAYVEFEPEGMIIAPQAISDNGLWVVGNYNDGTTPNSYIYDVRRDSLEIVEGVILYDITDDGAAYGMDRINPIIYKNGEKTSITAPAGAAESGFYAVTPDGSVAVGYSMTEAMENSAIIYENGTLSTLTGTDLTDHAPAGIVAKGIGSNGNIAGYLVDFETYFELGCCWTGEAHEFSLFPKDHMVWNDELMGGTYEKRYGDLGMYISPDGRYLASIVEIKDSWDYMPLRPYVYDLQEGKIYETTSSYDEYRPCAITSDGLVILADKMMGVSEVPYVYDIHTGEGQTFEAYASATYGYSVPAGVTIQGSILAVDAAARVFVGNYLGDSSYITAIYFMPEE